MGSGNPFLYTLALRGIGYSAGKKKELGNVVMVTAKPVFEGRKKESWSKRAIKKKKSQRKRSLKKERLCVFMT